MQDLTEAIQHIQETATAHEREAILNLEDGRKFIYDDAEQRYEAIERFVKFEGSVSTVESFGELVVEYAQRFEQKAAGDPDVKPTGRNQTVTFTSDGAWYSPDDDDRRHKFTYKRVPSQQWNALKAALNRPMSHKDLIRTLQTLSPSIENYALVITAFRRLIVSKDVKLASEPILNAEGQSGNAYSILLSVKGGTTETTLPSTLDVKLQFARGSEATYIVPVEVDLTEKDDIPVITLFAPTLDAIADKAVLDEMRFFDERMDRSGLTDLLMVVNF